jgi:curved DNA-binding protein CbpA
MADTSEERPAPSATGSLATRPLVHLLVYARNRRLTGRLALSTTDGRSGVIDLWRGRIHDARTVPPVAYFGAVAYELGHIDTQTLNTTLLEIANTKRLHGEILIEHGSLTPALRDLVLAEQTCRKVHHLFTLPPEATFAFYEARPGLEEPPFTLDPIQPAWRGLREHPPVESVREVVARYGGAALRLANEGPIAGAGFDADESAVCEALLWKPMTLPQLRATSRLPNERLELLVYLLVITKCAEPVTASSPELPAVSVRPPGGATPAAPLSSRMPAAPPSSRPSMPTVTLRPSSGSMPAAPLSSPRGSMPAAPPSSRPSMPVMPRTVLRPSGMVPSGAGRDMRTLSTPAMPAVTVADEARHSLSFRVPSAPVLGAAGGSSPKIATLVAPVFSPADLGAVGIEHRAATVHTESPWMSLGLSEGATVEAARAAYFRLVKIWHPDRLPADLAPYRVEVEKIFDHMTRAHRTLTEPDARREYLAGGRASAVTEARPRAEVLRDIEQALTKRDFYLAESTAQKLASADADDAEAQAYVAWASTQAGEAPEETLRAAVLLLDRAVNRDCDCEVALFYRGLLHKRLGGSAQAFRDFVRVSQINPKHVDAQREIRIFEMRARKGGSGEHLLSSTIAKAKRK